MSDDRNNVIKTRLRGTTHYKSKIENPLLLKRNSYSINIRAKISDIIFRYEKWLLFVDLPHGEYEELL